MMRSAARIATVQERLDAQADGDGLTAEAGAGEEMGLAEGSTPWPEPATRPGLGASGHLAPDRVAGAVDERPDRSDGVPVPDLRCGRGSLPSRQSDVGRQAGLPSRPPHAGDTVTRELVNGPAADEGGPQGRTDNARQLDDTSTVPDGARAAHPLYR